METSENKARTIQYLTEFKKQLLERREGMMRPILELDKQISAVVSTLSLILDSSRPVEDGSPRTVLIRRISTMTQPQALVAIADYNNGLLNAQEAKVLMIHAGIMKETKNSASTIHSVIARTRKFVRVGRGKYRLQPVVPGVEPRKITLVGMASGQSPFKPVQ